MLSNNFRTKTDMFFGITAKEYTNNIGHKSTVYYPNRFEFIYLRLLSKEFKINIEIAKNIFPKFKLPYIERLDETFFSFKNVYKAHLFVLGYHISIYFLT